MVKLKKEHIQDLIRDENYDLYKEMLEKRSIMAELFAKVMQKNLINHELCLGAIADGYKLNFSDEQFMFYEKVDFDRFAMNEVNKAFEKGLTLKQAEVCFDNKFGALQMEVLVDAFLSNFTQEQIELFAKPELSHKQMKTIKCAIQEGVKEEHIKEYADAKYNDKQMLEIILAYEQNLPDTFIKRFAIPEFNHEQMREIRLSGLHDYTKTFLDLFINPKLDSWQMNIIISGIQHGLQLKKLKLYADPDYTYEQMKQMLEALVNKVPSEKVALYMTKQTSADNMWAIRKTLEGNLGEDCLNYVVNPKFNKDQLRFIIWTFTHKLDKTWIEFIAKPEYTDSTMSLCIDGFSRGYTKEQVELYANPKYTTQDMENIMDAISSGLSSEEIKAASVRCGSYTLGVIFRYMKYGLTKEQYDILLSENFDEYQLSVLYGAVTSKVKLKHVKLFAKKYMSSKIMSALSLALEKGCEIEKIEILSRSKLYISFFNASEWYVDSEKEKRISLLVSYINDLSVAQLEICSNFVDTKFSKEVLEETIQFFLAGHSIEEWKEITKRNGCISYYIRDGKRQLLAEKREKELSKFFDIQEE